MPDRLSHFTETKRKNPRFNQFPLLLAFGLCIGAAWYCSYPREPDGQVLLALAAISLIFSGLIVRFVRTPPAFLGLLILGMGVIAGGLAGKLAVMRVSHPVISAPIGPVMLEGWVEEVEPANRGVRLRLIVHAIDDLPRNSLPDRVRVTHTTRLEVDAGRFVRCWAVLRPPPAPIIEGDYAFHRQAYFEGLGAVGYVQGRCRGGTLGQPNNLRDRLSLTVAKYRRNLAYFVNEASGERAGGFAAALASGDRSFMRQEDQEALRGSGLAHLLAISGLHMGIVGGLIYLIVWRGLALIEPLALRIHVQKPAAIAALLASFTYFVLSGASVSTQRAFIMAAVLFGAVLVDRAALSLRSLAIAMIIVVAIAPWSVLTPGFQMSFAATGALIATYEAWQRRQRENPERRKRGVIFWVKSLVVTSFVSGFATMPFALYHFDRVAAFGFIANLMAMPIISLVTAPLAATALILSPIGLSMTPLRLFGASLEAILWVAHTFSDLAPDGAQPGKPMPVTTLVLWTSALVLACIAVGWKRRLMLGGLMGAVGAGFWSITPTASLHWAPSGEVFLVQSSGAVERLAFANGDGLAPLRYVDAEIIGDCSQYTCRRRIGVHQILIMSEPTTLSCRELEAASLVLTLAEDAKRSECDAKIVSWQDTIDANGQSWSLYASEPVRVPRQACGTRPWNPCATAP